MYQLSDQQIDFILDDISARGVEMESLQQNLLDHVCCIIEQNLEANGDFESFYQKTIKTFYKDELWEIEEETLLLLTYKNYYTMKKVMIYSGIAAASSFIIGSFFKIMHWPGAAALILLGMAISTLVFLPLLFLFKKNETTETRSMVVLGVGVTNGIIFCVWSLFKVMHWPGANMLWFVTIGLFSLVFIPLYFFSGIKNPANKINTITTTIILIIVAGVFFLQTTLKSSSQVYLAKMYHLTQSEELIKRLEQLKTDTTHSKELTNLSKEILEKCNSIKGMIIYDELGQKSVPSDFAAKNIWITESGLGDEFKPGGEGEKMVIDLKNLLNQYNSLAGNKAIPNSTDKLLENVLLQHSNYNVLENVVNIQLFVLLNEK